MGHPSQQQRTLAINAELNYVVKPTEPLRTYTHEPPIGVAKSNVTPESHVVTIHDARPFADSLSLDIEGFEILRYRSRVQDFYNDEEVRTVYYPESEAALKAATGADRVVIFDHTVRRRIPGADDTRIGPRQPAARIHVDQTVKSGPQRVRDLLPDEAEELLHGRVQIINLWRPIRGPLQDMPLAMCDARSVAPDDLLPAALIYPDRTGEIYSVKFNPDHQWFYVPEMQPDEALLLKCYDSKTDGRARFLPHTAFADPTTPSDAPLRESIEIRALVFHRS